jgi:plastocyanin
MTVGVAGKATAAPARQAGPQTWTVLVGAQAEIEQTDMGPAGAWQLMKFYPDKLTINEGDTVVWKINSAEFHDVIFAPPGQAFMPLTTTEGGQNGPPTVVISPLFATPTGGPNYDGTTLVSSGELSMAAPGSPEYRLTFTKGGSYDYYCNIHSSPLPNGQIVGMTGNITVQAAGSALAKTADQVSADAQAAIAADQQAAMAEDAQVKQAIPPTSNSDGTMTYYIMAGFDTQTASYMRFTPSDITIHAGDTVTWQQNAAISPHTFSLTSGAKDPDLVVALPQQSGPPKLILNPQVLLPAGGSTYAGQGFFSSGFVAGTQDPAPGPRTYSLKFSTPGTYEYICILHDDMGMSGHITVLAAGDTGMTPGMPSTGSPGGADGLLLAAWLVSQVLLLAGLTLRRKVISLRRVNRST